MTSFQYGKEFPIDPSIVYLNHAGVGPWPLRTREAVRAFATENTAFGATHYPAWTATEKRLREQLRDFINAPSADDIALLKNTSEGISLIAAGLPWQHGDNVVISDQEFPSNRWPWEALQARGVEVRIAALDVDDPEAALLAELDARTRVLAISAVQYATGLRMDLPRLGAACRANGTFFCIDAIQQLGALKFDTQAAHADFVVADAHKWLLSPEGTAVFYATPAARDALTLQQYGWHMAENAGHFDSTNWTPARNARRFECGSPNTLGIYALSATMDFFAEAGMDDVEQRVLANAGYLAEHMAALPGWSLVSRRDQPRFHSGIVTAKHASGKHTGIFRALRDDGIICAERGGGIRFSPHAWLSRSQLDRALASLEKASGSFRS